MSLHRTCSGEDWDELDAIVGAELDRVLARRAEPVAEPEVSDAMFLDRAMIFLRTHPEPMRLVAELQNRLVPLSALPPERPFEAGEEDAVPDVATPEDHVAEDGEEQAP